MAASRTTATTGGTPRFGDESNGGGEAQRGDFAKKKKQFSSGQRGMLCQLAGPLLGPLGHMSKLEPRNWSQMCILEVDGAR
jgi:hypothetical protein